MAHAGLDPSGNLPRQLVGTSVEVNGRPCGLVFVSPTQINFHVPRETDLGTAQVLVRRDGLGLVGQGVVPLRNSVPALFSLDGSGQGRGAVINAVTSKLDPFDVSTPENPGADKRTRLSLFATGLRFAGNPARAPEVTNVAAFVRVEGRDSAGRMWSLAVEYAGAAPGFFGLDQVNVVVPGELQGAGTVALTVTAETFASNAVTCTIRGLQEGIEVLSFSGNSHYRNSGWTAYSTSSVALGASGSTVTGSLRYEVFDRLGTTAIVQLFVAVERTVVWTLYNGIPGPSGRTGSSSFSFAYDRSRYGPRATIYLAGTWAMSEAIGIEHYQQGGGWRCPIGIIVAGPVSGEGMEVRSWEDSQSSHYRNGGDTAFSGSSVRLGASGNTVTGSLNYEVFDRNNPPAIVQLFVAVERTVVWTLYNGIPGASGRTGSGSVSFPYDTSKYGPRATIYLAGTWAMSEALGKDAYQQGHGWRCPVGIIIAEAVSGEEIAVEAWENSHYRNSGRTAFSASSVALGASGSTVTGSLRYEVFDRVGTTAIVQLFVAVERTVVWTLYNGIPGPSGRTGSASFSFPYDRSKYGPRATIYLAGTWTMSEALGKDAYQQGHGWRCPIGIIMAGPVSGEGMEVRSWGDSQSSHYRNGGETAFAGSSVRLAASGNTVTGSLNYEVFDRDNPPAIVQLFVAVERTVVATLYNGIPGPSGRTGSASFSFLYDRSKYGPRATIYLAGTWAMNEAVGKDAYQQGHGWRCPIGIASTR